MSNNQDIFANANVNKTMNYACYPNNFTDNVIDDDQLSKHDLVIKPSTKSKVSEATQIPLQLIVDSRDRDTSSYSNPNSYRVQLPDTYQNITSIELIGAEIPKTQYVINTSNNTIHYHDGTGNDTVVVSSGTYTITDLISKINTGFDDNSNNNITLSVANTANNPSQQQKIQIANTTGSTVKFFWKADKTENIENGKTRVVYRDNSMAKVLGFDRSDITLANAGTTIAPNRYDLNVGISR